MGTKTSQSNRSSRVLGSILGGIGGVAVLVGAVYFVADRFNKVDANREKIDNLRSSLDKISSNVKDVRDRVDAVFDLASSLPPGEAKERFGELSVGLHDLAEMSRTAQTELVALRVQMRKLDEFDALHKRIQDRQDGLQDLVAKDVSDIRDGISSMREKLAGLEAFERLMEKLIPNELALGRVTTDDLSEVYTQERIADFLEKARDLLRERSNKEGGRGGGGGGGGGFVPRSIAEGTRTMDKGCAGPAFDCLSVSLLGPSRAERLSMRPREARIELYYGQSVAEILAEAMPQKKDRSIFFRELQGYKGKLCEFFASRSHEATLDAWRSRFVLMPFDWISDNRTSL